MKKLDEILAGKKSVGMAGHVRPDGVPPWRYITIL